MNQARTILGVAVIAAGATTAALLPTAALAASSQQARSVFTFTGSLPADSGSQVTLVAEVEQRTAAGLTDTPVAQMVTSGTVFTLSVPPSARLTQASQAGHGVANFDLIAYTATSMTSQYVPVTLTAAGAQGNTAAVAEVRAHTVRVPAFGAFRSMPAATRRALRPGTDAIPPPCHWERDGREVEDTTRINQIHVNQANGLTLRFEYHTQADTTLSVGESETGEKGWTASGSVTVTNSMGSNGGFTVGDGVLFYVDGHMYYQKYAGTYDCPKPFKVQVDHAAGDAFEGDQNPKPNPYGGCYGKTDPFGSVELNPHGYFDSDHSTAAGYDGAATVWGFSFSGHTGFTKDIEENYTNNDSDNQYLCGTTYMPGVPIIYSDIW